MKQLHITFLITVLMSMVGVNVLAHDFEVANADGKTIYYVKTSDTEVAVSFKGARYYDYSDEYSGNVVIPELVFYKGNYYHVTSIYHDAFNNCPSLTSVTIPNSVTSIDYFAFLFCYGLSSITIPQSVTYISSEAFISCRGLVSINVESGNTAYDSRQNCNAIIEKLSNKLIAGCKNSFIPNGVKEIGDDAFSDCIGLKSIDIPNSVEKIGFNSFQDCRSLTSITIPNSVTSIGTHAFQYCNNLTSVTVEWTEPISINSNDTFSNRANATLYVPKGSKAAYEAADYWKEFKEIVELPAPSNNITFADANVKAICVANWDTNSDGELSEEEAAAVTDIGNVFQGKANITSFDELQFFTGLTSIGSYAFYGCSGLTSVTIGNSVTSIGQYAFRDCGGLTSVTIGNSVTSIGKFAFDDCRSLEKVIVQNIASWCNISFRENSTNPLYYAHHLYSDENTEITNLVIPNSVTSIGERAFIGCSDLTSVTIPNSVTSIGLYAFEKCSGLEKVIVEDLAAWCNISFDSGYSNPLSYAHHLYSDENTEITDLVIPNSVTSIAERAFVFCSGLTSVTIPNSVSSIGSLAFQYCSSLTSVTIPNSVTSIASSAFEGCSSLTSVTIPNSVSSIASSAFEGCSSLTSVTIPNSVTSIASSAFEGCSSLTSVTIPNSVSSIGSLAFQYCSSLTSVTIPNSVTSIGNQAFCNCSGLTSVTVEWSEPISISSNVFSNRANATLYVPVGSKSAYEAADYWKEFGNIVAIGDVFTTKTIEDVDMSFVITSICPLEVQVGNGTNAAISKTCAGMITIPSSVTIPGSDLSFTVSQIGANAFNGCNLITSVGIPVSISSIGKSVFYGCSGLQEVVLPNSIKTIPESLNIGYGTSQGFTSIDGVVENIHVPSSVTWIGRYAINQCDNVVIEDGNSDLQLQDRNADDGYYDGTLYGVKELYVGRNTDNNSFSSAGQTFLLSGTSYSELNNITFGPLVTKAFWGYDFRGCSSVTSVTCLTKEPFTSPDFYTIPQKAVLYVPLGSQQQYASANGWSQFGNITEVTEVTITLDDTEMVYAGDFDLDFSNVDGLKAYIAGDFDEAASTITLNPIQLVSAGKGVILKGAKGTYTVPCANIEATTADALCGTISGRFIRNVEDECVNYAFDKDEHVFKPVDAAYGCLISRNGAYLSLPASLISGNENITPIVLETESSSVDVTDISQLDNAIYLDEVEAIKGNQLTIEIKLKNAQPATAYVFDLVLPNGITVAKNAQGKYIDALSDRHDDHTRTFNYKGDNTYSLSALSGNSEPLTGNDGTIRILTLDVSDTMAEGTYAIEIKNASYSLVDGTLKTLPNTTSAITIEDYMLGDVNGNGGIDIGDAVSVVNYLVGKTSSNFIEQAADTNKNGQIDIGDAVTIVNYLVGKTASLSREEKWSLPDPQ